MATLPLDGKRALVTGGSRGLGQALCAALAEAGARVAFTYTRDAAGAEDTLARVRAARPDGAGAPDLQGRAFQVSVTDAAATTAMVRELESAWGGIDVLVNNAALS